MRTISKAAMTAGLSAVVIASLAGTALADPPNGRVPAAVDIVGVGSDTTQGVLNQVAIDYNRQRPKPTRRLNSFDAVGAPSITPKAGCADITRPNGSGAGITALKANARPSGDSSNYCIDFARSSRAPQAGDGTGLAFIRFAQDAVTWSSTSTPTSPSNAPASLSNKELKAIYQCDASILGTGKTGAVTFNEVGGTGNDAVVPVIPQSSSGTRAFFLKAIGVTTLGNCVQGTDNTVEENEGTNPIFSSNKSEDIVFPYSIAVYIAQSQNGHGTGMEGNQVLGSAENTHGVVIPPTVGSPGKLSLNPSLASVQLTRFVYNVVRNDGTSTHVPDYLQPVFGASDSSGYICNKGRGLKDITSYGFRSIGSSCGSVEIPTS